MYGILFVVGMVNNRIIFRRIRRFKNFAAVIYYVYVKLGKRVEVFATTILRLFAFFKEGASCVAPSVAKTQALA